MRPLLVLSLAFSLSACGGSEKAPETAPGPPKATAPKKSTKQDTIKRRRARKRRYFKEKQKETFDRIQKLYDGHKK